VTIKGKHLCRSINIEQNSLVWHKKTKDVLFKHEWIMLWNYVSSDYMFLVMNKHL
jgi:hypothetical protein